MWILEKITWLMYVLAIFCLFPGIHEGDWNGKGKMAWVSLVLIDNVLCKYICFPLAKFKVEVSEYRCTPIFAAGISRIMMGGRWWNVVLILSCPILISLLWSAVNARFGLLFVSLQQRGPQKICKEISLCQQLVDDIMHFSTVHSVFLRGTWRYMEVHVYMFTDFIGVWHCPCHNALICADIV